MVLARTFFELSGFLLQSPTCLLGHLFLCFDVSVISLPHCGSKGRSDVLCLWMSILFMYHHQHGTWMKYSFFRQKTYLWCMMWACPTLPLKSLCSWAVGSLAPHGPCNPWWSWISLLYLSLKPVFQVSWEHSSQIPHKRGWKTTTEMKTTTISDILCTGWGSVAETGPTPSTWGIYMDNENQMNGILLPAHSLLSWTSQRTKLYHFLSLITWVQNKSVIRHWALLLSYPSPVFFFLIVI
jgi:hypothetical protein